MLVDGVFGIEETFDAGNWKRDLDPVFGRSVLEVSGVNAIIKKPLVNKLQRFVGGLD